MKLNSVTLDEVISYSKQKEVPRIIIIDDCTKEEADYIETVSERLSLCYLQVKSSNKIAFINCSELAVKIAKNLKKRLQVMYQDYSRRPTNLAMYAMTKYTKDWITLRDNGYIVKAYNADGEEIEQWIDTNVVDVSPIHLNRYNFKSYSISLHIRSCGSSFSSQILELSRQNFINNGIYNEIRNCYYPRDRTTHAGISMYNKLEKLFQKHGFSSLK